MGRSYIFVLLAIALCFTVSVYASDDESDNEALLTVEEAIDTVQELADEALTSAKTSLNQANSIKARVESYKNSATGALSQASSLSKGNTQAENIVTQIKETSNEIIALYPNASKAAAEAVTKMQDLMKTANKLKSDADIIAEPDSNSSDNYMEANQEIANVTARVEAFQQEIPQKVTILNPASVLAQQMLSLLENIKVGKSHISVILHVSQIETALKKAEVDLRSTEQRKEDINKIVDEMKEFSKNASAELSVYVSKMIGNAEIALSTASNTVNAATKARNDMLEKKQNADSTLAKFSDATVSQEITSDVSNVKAFVKEIEKKAAEIEKALQSAEITAKGAESDRQSFIKTLSPGKLQLNEEEDKEKNKQKEHVKDKGTNPVSNDEAASSTTNTESNTQAVVQTISKSGTHSQNEKTNEQEQTLNGATETPQNGLKEKQTTISSETTVIGTSENLIQKATENTKIENKKKEQVKHSELLKGILQKNANKETKLPLVDDNIPAFGVLGDSSMFLSVSLLAALIASAVLH